MADRNSIITLPHPHLREKSARVHVITDDTLKVVADMEAATLDWEDSRPHELGVALAAVQINELQRIVVVRNDFDNKQDRSFTVLINPEIVKLEGQIQYDHEGCLSVKNVYGLVPRHSKVRIKAINLQGQEIRIKAEGFLARLLQHEIDHTNGIVFIDHIENNRDAFYTLTEDGKLEKVDYEKVADTGIFR